MHLGEIIAALRDTFAFIYVPFTFFLFFLIAAASSHFSIYVVHARFGIHHLRGDL